MKALSFVLRSIFVVCSLLVALNSQGQQNGYINKIPIPPIVSALDGPIHLQIQKKFHKFNPGMPGDTLNGGSSQPNGIPTYAYNIPGQPELTILGPTLHWFTHYPADMTIENKIGIASTTHWHGAELPSEMDGGPHQEIKPDSTWTAPDFNVIDSACTMWYHPHFHDRTVQQVQRGLSGMIIINDFNDPIHNTLPHTYGVDDIPLIIGDLGVKKNGNGTAWNIDTVKGKRPINLVNGLTNPYVEVPSALVRLRILNGSTRKAIAFGVGTTETSPVADLLPFYLIATDGGYTIKPDTLETLTNGPGARDEIVIDLSGYQPGTNLYLRNLNHTLPNSVIGSPLQAPNGGGQDATIGNAFIQLRVVSASQFPNYSPITTFVPFTTTWTPGLADTSNIAHHRLKRLVHTVDTFIVNNQIKTENQYTIDSLHYEQHRIDDTICVGTKEIWTIHNISNVAHPFHIHKIQFRILDIVDSSGAYLDLAARGLNGPKDDVLIFPGWKLRFLGQFDDYPSEIDPHHGYMYHCHILTHEDSIGGGMMHQFVVTNEGPCEEVAVHNPSHVPNMQLFPNPAENVFQMKGLTNKPSMVIISDLQGRRLKEEQIPAFQENTTIRTDGLPNGVYLVQWRIQGGIVTKKLVIQRL